MSRRNVECDAHIYMMNSGDVQYFAGENVEDLWICYPWDAAVYGHSIFEHEKIARSTCQAAQNEKKA